MNKQDLLQKIKQLEGLTQEERAELVNLLNTKKKYGLIWEDKPEDVEEQLRTQLPVLREVVERRILSESEFTEFKNEQKKSVAAQQAELFDTEDDTLNINTASSSSSLGRSGGAAPNHILIEGDNLHALTALTFTHEGKIDVIYIDPPYNTGNKDFKYNDAFVDKEDSYRHSKWLSFMHKRLEIAKRLMSDKGVIFMSIDDNEQAQLKLISDEVFGNLNYMGNIIWQSRTSISNDDFISTNHNHTHIYAKNINLVRFDGEPIDHSEYKNPDNDVRGPWKLVPIDANKAGGDTLYAITNPKTGKEYYPPGKRIWAVNRVTYQNLHNDGRIKFGLNDDSSPKRKLFLNERLEKGDSKTPSSLLMNAGTTKDGTNELIEILEIKKFDYPKPSSFIKRLLNYSSQFNNKITILDFFAGSGTTLHATMQLNSEDGGSRQCILVTNNENNICEEVTYERNKRVIQGYTNAKGVQVEGLRNNNLRYYRSEYVGRAHTHKNKKELVLAATELLSIKEDIYTELAELNGQKLNNKVVRCFSDKGKYMLVIYDEEAIETLLPLISTINSHKKIKIYIFAPGQYPFTEEFEDVLDKVELCALPDAIYKAYANVLPKKKAKPTVAESEEEITESETSESDEPNLFTV